jgi:hypothetical protein
MEVNSFYDVPETSCFSLRGISLLRKLKEGGDPHPRETSEKSSLSFLISLSLIIKLLNSVLDLLTYLLTFSISRRRGGIPW